MRGNKAPATGLAALRALRQRRQADSRHPRPEPAGTPAADTGTFSELLQGTPPTANRLSAEDRALFRQETRNDLPLVFTERHTRHTVPTLDRLQKQQRQQHATGPEWQAPLPLLPSDHYVPAWLESDPCEYSSPACGTDVLRHLKQGRWMISANLDLHGARLEEARLLVTDFLQTCLTHRFKCVRIVHGVGYGSNRREGPILLPVVRRWLSQMQDVLAYVECSAREGGKGAVKVLLRTYRD